MKQIALVIAKLLVPILAKKRFTCSKEYVSQGPSLLPVSYSLITEGSMHQSDQKMFYPDGLTTLNTLLSCSALR